MSLKKFVLATACAFSFAAFAQGKPAEAGKPAEPGKSGEAKEKKEEKKAEKAEKKDEKAEKKDGAAAAAMPAMPTMPPEGKKWIEGWLGNWKSADTTMTMGDKTMKGKMDMKCEKVSDGWGTLCRGKVDMGKEMPAQQLAVLFGWNIGEGMATMFEVTNMAEVHNHTGKWTDDKTITVTHEGKTAEGKVEKDAFTATWNSPKELAIKAEGTSGGATVWTMTATAKK